MKTEDEISLSGIISQNLLLNLSCNNMYPSEVCYFDGYVSLGFNVNYTKFSLEITDKCYSIVVIGGKMITAYNSQTIELLDPESMINKLSRVCLFIKSVSGYIYDMDPNWIGHGIKTVVDCGDNIQIKQSKYIPYNYSSRKQFDSLFLNDIFC